MKISSEEENDELLGFLDTQSDLSGTIIIVIFAKSENARYFSVLGLVYLKNLLKDNSSVWIGINDGKVRKSLTCAISCFATIT